MKIEQIIIQSMIGKFEEMRTRMLKAVNQLNEEQLNWRPNDESNSIANIAVHIQGNYKQRIIHGILGHPDERDREAEFDSSVYLKPDEIVTIINEIFDGVADSLQKLAPEDLLKPSYIRSRQVTVYELYNQCSTHYSEHLGQILYLAKMFLNDAYETTSVPRRKEAR
ncbi:DUF1572 family protein [Paenibacillus alkalitolerans]|uniref:DUF1572 family protein n=1 Tax=Paenibacillus alkalitolerans TaxID=2799335 RepID=UPI0018F42A8E|nr:DUF1572 family protein [Paenibacillus alkalitolerans]